MERSFYDTWLLSPGAKTCGTQRLTAATNLAKRSWTQVPLSADQKIQRVREVVALDCQQRIDTRRRDLCAFISGQLRDDAAVAREELLNADQWSAYIFALSLNHESLHVDRHPPSVTSISRTRSGSIWGLKFPSFKSSPSECFVKSFHVQLDSSIIAIAVCSVVRSIPTSRPTPTIFAMLYPRLNHLNCIPSSFSIRTRHRFATVAVCRISFVSTFGSKTDRSHQALSRDFAFCYYIWTGLRQVIALCSVHIEAA